MSAVGEVRGTLRLKIGDSDVNLGEVSIPLVVESPLRRDSGDEPAAIRLVAYLERVRNLVQELMRSEVSGDE